MSLNLNDRPSARSPYHMSPGFNDAVNDAQFVRTFGVAAFICSILTLFWAAIPLGVSLAVIGFGKSRYYRVLGLIVVVLAIAGILIAPLRVIGAAALSVGVGWRGIEILGLLAKEGRGDPDWQVTRQRSIVGVSLSALGLLVCVVWVSLFLLALLGAALS
jgi:hypothetical protein